MKSEIVPTKLLNNGLKKIFFVLLMGLSACSGGGGGGTSPPVQKTGVFFDSVVSGAGFSTSSGITGTTNTSGEFQYLSGDEVVFSIGNIDLPPVTGADFVTPLQMGVTKSINEQIVINIIRFLQSIDSDGNANNEITLPAPGDIPAGSTMDFAQNEPDFEVALTAFLNALPGGNQILVTTSDAQSNFETSLFQQMAGTYNGTFSGEASGRLRLDIDSLGKITGTAKEDRPGQFDTPVDQLSGSVQSDGSAFIDVVAVGKSGSFIGTMTLSGEMSGTWSISSESGTFTGKKEFLEDGFLTATLPGVYDFVQDGSEQNDVYTFNEPGNSFVDFGDNRSNRDFTWFVDSQGRLILTFSNQAGLPDRITLVGGTTLSGQVSLDADDDDNGNYEVFLTGSFTKRP